MGKIYQTFLTDAAHATWRSSSSTQSSPTKHSEKEGSNICVCRQCKAHLCLTDNVISKGFHGKHGKAYLAKSVENILTGEHEDRLLMTGLHTICDIFCIVCEAVLGWKYIHAFEDSQKFKEGACILERTRIKMISGQPKDNDCENNTYDDHDDHLIK